MNALTREAHVGQYAVVREVGKGAMATVYEAKHLDLGKRVAIKVMHAHLAKDETASSRFLREGKAAAQIHSPHVVDVFDVGTQDGVPYLVMELLDGLDLAASLRARRKLPLRELADLMLPIASAVHAAHEVGVIHRDLKPSNVFLAKRDGGAVSPTILDFGISKVTSEMDRDLTASEVLLGTVHYMSPEQTRGGKNASALSDQYSLGVMLCECATGSKPFVGESPYALMHAIVSARVTPPSVLEPSLPAAFDEVVLRAMHRDPKKRFSSVRALGVALVPFASEDAQKRWAGEFGVAPAPAGASRRGLTLGAAALVCLALALFIASAAGRRGAAASAASPPVAPARPGVVAGDPPTAEPAKAAAAGVTSTAEGAVSASSGGGASSAAVSTAIPSPIVGTPSHRTPDAAVSPSASTRVAPTPARPERGTNGALIVE